MADLGREEMVDCEIWSTEGMLGEWDEIQEFGRHLKPLQQQV